MEKQNQNTNKKSSLAISDALQKGDAPVSAEKDFDELIHSNTEATPPISGTQDPDEAIHQEHKQEPLTGSEVDVDDLLHQPPDEEA